jgi:hypothetical protein
LSYAPRYEYAGGVLPEDEALIEQFERELLPYLEKMGPYIGELAMGNPEKGVPGWKVAEEIVLRHNGLLHGMPVARRFNLARLMAALSIWKERWEEVRSGGVTHAAQDLVHDAPETVQ